MGPYRYEIFCPVCEFSIKLKSRSIRVREPQQWFCPIHMTPLYSRELSATEKTCEFFVYNSISVLYNTAKSMRGHRIAKLLTKKFFAARFGVSDVWNLTEPYFDPICYNASAICGRAHCAETVKDAANKKEVSKARTQEDRTAKTILANLKRSKKEER